MEQQNTPSPERTQRRARRLDKYGNPFKLGDTLLYAVRDERTALLKEGTITTISTGGFPCVFKGKPIKALDRVVNLSALLTSVKKFEKALDKTE